MALNGTKIKIPPFNYSTQQCFFSHKFYLRTNRNAKQQAFFVDAENYEIRGINFPMFKRLNRETAAERSYNFNGS
jgi:hypothetical protein